MAKKGETKEEDREQEKAIHDPSRAISLSYRLCSGSYCLFLLSLALSFLRHVFCPKEKDRRKGREQGKGKEKEK